MKNSLYISAFLLSFTLFSAAAAFGQASGEWRVAEVNGRVVPSGEASLNIDLAARRFTGSGGCNRIFGRVTAGAGRIAFANVGSTRRACTSYAKARREQAFIRTLAGSASFRVTGDRLMLIRGRRVVVVLERDTVSAPIPGDRLEGRFNLEFIGSRDVRRDANGAFVNFDPVKKSAGGNTGCNVFGGSYSQNGSRVSITDTIGTMRACEEGDLMTIERSFLDGLRRADRFTLSAGVLTLYRGGTMLLRLRRA